MNNDNSGIYINVLERITFTQSLSINMAVNFQAINVKCNNVSIVKPSKISVSRCKYI